MQIDEGNIDINDILSKIQNILNKTHTIEEKKRIRLYPSEHNPERIAFSCPICGDSDRQINKKRGNFYIKNMHYICYNCDSRMSITKFLDTFNENISMEDRIKIYNYIDNNVRYTRNNNEFVLEALDKLINIDDFAEYFNNKKNSWLVDIKPVQLNSHVYQYLKYQRYMPDFNGIYEGMYRVIKGGKIVFRTKVLINMNVGMDKLLGIQLRNLEKDPAKRFYKIVEFDEIYNYMNPTNPLDEIEAISYNKLSHFYNILNVNFESPVNIFEGYLDSKFSNNGIGLVGIGNTDDLLNFLLESDDDLELRFFYDNDAAGIKKSTEMLKKGYPVFLWNLLFDKLTDKAKNKYTSKDKLKNIKDLNDLAINSKNPNIYDKLKLDKFFSKDSFDIIYLDQIKYNKDDRKWEVKR